MLDDYFKLSPGVKILPWLGIGPPSPSRQPVVIAMSYNDPMFYIFVYKGLPFYL